MRNKIIGIGQHESTFGAVYVFALVNIAVIASALVAGIFRVTFNVVTATLDGTFAVTQILLLVLIGSLITFQIKVYKQWQSRRTYIFVANDFNVVAPCDRRDEYYRV